MRHTAAICMITIALGMKAQSAGDYATFRKAAGVGDTKTYTTPVNTSLFSLNGSGTFTFLAQSTFLTPAQGNAAYSLLGHTHTASEVTDFNAAGDARWSLLSHVHAAADITSGTIATARLGSGTANSTTYLRGDQTWQTISAGVTDHGALTGLSDDDHPQYHNDARGDARYSLLGHAHDVDEITGLISLLDDKAGTPATTVVGDVPTFSDVSGNLQSSGLNLSEIVAEDPGAGVGLIESGAGVSPIILKNLKSGSGTTVTANTGSVQVDIASDGVANTMLANMAQGTIKGRAAAAGTGDPTDLTADQVSTILDGAADPFLRTSAAGGGGTWGSISGTLSDQADLQTALDAKVQGPGSSQDNQMVRFDGTTGLLVKDGSIVSDDGATVTVLGDILIDSGSGQSTFNFGQSNSVEDDNAAVFGRSNTIVGSGGGSENSVVFGHNGTISNASNAALFALSGSPTVTAGGSFNVYASQIVLSSGVVKFPSMPDGLMALTGGDGTIDPVGMGTGVRTALGVNVGSTGAFVANGGALGTPSSGVATNLTGTAAGLNIGGNAATVTTNANLVGPVTSFGNTTSIANGAISNAMLANGAVANLSGTNTGDQTITNSSDATSHTVTLSASGGSVQLIEGSGVTLTTGGTGSAGTVTIAATGGSFDAALTMAYIAAY